MRAFVVAAALLLASTCSASLYGPVSTQYHSQDHIGGYAYGYAGPLSQKQEARSADGTTQGSYSYVDANGLLQSVAYVADPHNGFRATGTNFPQAPAPVAAVAAHAPAPWAYSVAPYHVPVITPLGVPADTPEVAAAKAAHLAAHAAARYGHHLHKRSLWGGHSAWAPAPVIHNGVPVDTPEVQHAKAAHFAAYAKAAAETGVAAHGGYAAPGAPYGSYHIPVIANGVPVETPEVQHAKAAHFAAVAKASAAAAAAPAGPAPSAYHGAYAHPGAYAHAPAAPYNGPIHIPVIQNGVPVEPAEVQHARAAHLAALHGAGSGAGVYANGHWDQDGQYRHDVNGW